MYRSVTCSHKTFSWIVSRLNDLHNPAVCTRYLRDALPLVEAWCMCHVYVAHLIFPRCKQRVYEPYNSCVYTSELSVTGCESWCQLSQCNHVTLLYTQCKQIAQLSPSSAILDFLNFKFVTVQMVNRVELHHRAKFRQNRWNHGWDMAIFKFSKWRLLPCWIFEITNF